MTTEELLMQIAENTERMARALERSADASERNTDANVRADESMIARHREESERETRFEELRERESASFIAANEAVRLNHETATRRLEAEAKEREAWKAEVRSIAGKSEAGK